MKDYIEIKPDKRFKPGHIKAVGHELRGNPDTIKMERKPVTPMMVDPPLVVGSELAKAIKKALK